MKRYLLLIALVFATALNAADLPTISVDHLYYLQARAERVRMFKPQDLIDYCIVQKIGGPAFESLYSQIFTMRIELTKLVKVDGVRSDDPRLVTLHTTIEEYSKLLCQEAEAIQNGIVHEGQVASDALTAIARVQNPQ